ncbi:MAG TPA: hypothetical protein VFV24_07405, partial [Candidatus Eisenbacteria bacterium]|nr:hypothetical protein [Candidatus Eisenbacteria bacterium]
KELSTFGPWGNKGGDLHTTITWSVEREDLRNRRSHQHARITARRGKERLVIEEDHILRLWTQKDVDRLVEQSPFDLAAVYHDRFEPFPMNVERTGEHGNLYHVLQRKK